MMEHPNFLNINNLKVTIFQAYLFWENIDKNLQNLALRLSTGVKEKTDLIVLPEMFNTGFSMMFNSSNCMVNVPKDKLVILQGLHDYIVVESNNTLLICPRSEEQTIKQVVADVKAKFGTKFI